MQENNLFEYAVIRYVPRPDRQEFLNIGVILYCVSKSFLNMRYSLHENRIKSFYDKSDIEELKNYLEAFKEVCCGSSENSPIAKLDIANRFRWLTATRSTNVQTSKVHPGLCDDPTDKLEKLQEQLVDS